MNDATCTSTPDSPETLPYQFRVTAYDPRLRGRGGEFLGDRWTSISDIGQVFAGEVLTRERYERAEAAHLRAVELFARESGVTHLEIRSPEIHGKVVLLSLDTLCDGYEVPLVTALELVRAMLREEGLWCLLEAEGRFFVHVGFGYYLYVGSHRPCVQVAEQVEPMGLFVEEFASPYAVDEDDEPYRPADETFWAEVEDLARRTGGELPLLEQWAGNAWRWHVVTPADLPRVRAALKPWAVVTAFVGPPSPSEDAEKVTERALRLLEEDSAVNGVMCLIEERDTGLLRHDYLLDEDDLPAWLEAARAAGRCGVYPADAVDQAGALEARMPRRTGSG
ncbi:hypothetical protein [Nonomuraea dietziae]|uniref:hypothetical protein n=1 Tax=Nonomuraea dietziae TaxID=65515 RepID=UPI0033D42D0B